VPTPTILVEYDLTDLGRPWARWQFGASPSPHTRCRPCCDRRAYL